MSTAYHVGKEGECLRVRSSQGGVMSHTPEPWVNESGAIYGENHQPIADTLRVLGELNQTNRYDVDGARIVACVNGCMGLNPAAYSLCVEALKRLIQEYNYLAVQAFRKGIKARIGEREVIEAVNHALAQSEKKG